ncbi:hypothetical protein LTR94_036146, partial [Friedmanniomyces endolithicus]
MILADPTAVPSVAAMVPAPPSTPCVMPEILLALGDREFVNDGSPRWTVEYALRALEMKNATDQVLPTLYALQQSARPVPRGWLGDRLTILWTHFSANRTYVDGQVLT